MAYFNGVKGEACQTQKENNINLLQKNLIEVYIIQKIDIFLKMGHIVLYNIYKMHLTEYINTVLLLVNSFKFTLKEVQSEPK